MGNKEGAEPQDQEARDDPNLASAPQPAPGPADLAAPLIIPAQQGNRFLDGIAAQALQYHIPPRQEDNPYALAMETLKNNLIKTNLSSSRSKKEAFDASKFEVLLPSLTLAKLENLDWVLDRYKSAEDIVKALDAAARHIAGLTAKLEMMKLDPISLLTSHQAHQWITEVVDVSSEYNAQNPQSWNRMCIIGPPNTYPRYGDLQSAWAHRQARGTLEFLEFKYQTPLHIIGVDIFETYNPGSVVRVSAHNGREWVTLWSGPVDQPNLPETSRIFTPPMNITPFKSNYLRVDLDCVNSRSWSEIDCVRMRGRECFEWEPRYHRRFPPEFREVACIFVLAMQRLEALPKDCIYEVLRKLSIHYT